MPDTREEENVGFERFDRKSRPTSPDPVMAIQKRGTFSLNAATHALLERDDVERDSEGRVHVELLYDPEEKLVGLRAVSPGPTTYPVRKQPNSESYLLSGRAFCMYHKIPVGETHQYEVQDFGDGIIGFSLEEDDEEAG